MTADNVRDKLRGDVSKADHPIDIVSIYQALSQCFDATNAKIRHRPTPGGSSTGFKNFPDEMPTTSTSPLDAICHWNLPVVAIDPALVAPGRGRAALMPCMDDYNEGGRSWTFRTDLLGSANNGASWTEAYKGMPTMSKTIPCKAIENGWVQHRWCCESKIYS